MDPNRCLLRLLDAIEAGDLEDAHDALDALHGWVRSGGFLPTFPGLDHPMPDVGVWHGAHGAFEAVLTRLATAAGSMYAPEAG